MFFLLRSACCIGLVVAALPVPGPDRGSLVHFDAARLVGFGAGATCRAAPARCRDLLSGAGRPAPADLFLALASKARARASSDTLTAADREFAWRAPPDSSMD